MKPVILVIDDNATNLKLAHWVLTSEGFDVVSVESAEKALAILCDQRPDLLLVDIALPGLSGLELTRMLRARADTRNLPIVAMTASAMKGDEAKALAAGCNAYLAKPVNTRILASQLRQVIATVGKGLSKT